MQFRQYLLLFGLLGILFIGIWILVRKSENEGRLNSDGAIIPEEISFNFHVKPILSDKCFICHGPDPSVCLQTKVD